MGVEATETKIQPDTKVKPAGAAQPPSGKVRAIVDMIRRGFDPVRKDQNKSPKKIKAFEVNQKVSHVVIQDLGKQGMFYREGDLGYYFHKASKLLISLIDDAQNLSLLLNIYGLNATEKIFDYVVEELRVHALKNGRQTKVYSFSHLRQTDGSESVLYIAADDNSIIRVTKDTIRVADNGVDGVLFMPSVYTAPPNISKLPHEGNGSFQDLILSKIPFNTESLETAEAQFLVCCWTICLVMRDLVMEKSILALIGPKGSGKTTAIRMVGRMLYGDRWDVIPISENDQNNFDTWITTQNLVGLDNVDGSVVWLNDKLAVVGTGGKIAKRVLYQTNRYIDYPIVAMIALSSRTPKFRRDDVAERLLLINTVRIDEAGDTDFKSDMLLPIEQRRSELWDDLISIFQRALKIIDETDWRSIQVPNVRMQEFTRFTVVVGQALGCEEIACSIAEKQRRLQHEFVIEGESWIEVLREWVTDNPGVFITTGDLNTALQEITQKRQFKWPFPNGKSLGQKIRHSKSMLLELFDIIEHQSATLKQTEYEFRLKDDAGMTSHSGVIPEVIPEP